MGGRTFFFNDQNTALNNLPASVVDKVRVINRDSEQTRATGLQDGQKEKILDVGLKKEYEKGWFGNVGAKGGATVAAAKADEPLRDNRGFLFGANALLSAYNEKDQVTVIANGQNVDDSGMVFIVSDGDNNWISSAQGLSTSAQAAVNANTSRIKDVETTVGVNGKYTDTDSGTQASRTREQRQAIRQLCDRQCGIEERDGENLVPRPAHFYPWAHGGVYKRKFTSYPGRNLDQQCNVFHPLVEPNQ